MTLLKDIGLNGLFLDILKEGIDNEDFQKRFSITLRITNTNSFPIKLSANLKYVSILYGFQEYDVMEPSLRNDIVIDTKQHTNVNILFEEVKKVNNQDRIILELDKIASLVLIRMQEKWYVQKIDHYDGDYTSISNQLKDKIERFEAIEERCGISFQNFSVKIMFEDSFRIFFEIIALDNDNFKKKFWPRAVVYDVEGNITAIGDSGFSMWTFRGFMAYSVTIRQLPIPFSKVGRIRLYPA